MTPKELFDLVKEMRSLQKEYFKTRSTKVLRKCTPIEKQVDAEIARVEEILSDKQMKLF